MLRFFYIFLCLIVASIVVSSLGFDLLKHNYWDLHGPILLIFLTLFPRLALLFSSIPFGGIFWFLGLIFFPRYLIATLATFNYWHQNPILVTLSWCIAIGGETTEKYYVKRGYVKVRKKTIPEENIIDVEAEPRD